MAEEKAPERKTAGRRSTDAGRSGRPGRSGGRRRPVREQDEFDQRLIDLARVTRVMAGGKRMRFRACVVVGDRKGRVGWGLAKGADVAIAMQKAGQKARKNIISVSMVNGTIPHEVRVKFKASKLLLKPAAQGKGLKAGGVVRTVLDLAGIENVVAKILGSNNKVNNISACIQALSSLRRVESDKPREAGSPSGKKNDSTQEAKATSEVGDRDKGKK